MDWLLAQDRALLLAINGLHGAIADTAMTLVSEKWFWIPLYILVIVLLVKQFGWKLALLALVAAGVTILFADQVASGLLKPLVARPRPCHEPTLIPLLHLVDQHCGGAYGFASSHAANFFGLATLVSGLLGRRHRWLALLMFGIATVVACSRIYLGVHYPGDVLAGAVIGVVGGLLGIFLFRISQNRLNFPQTARK